MNTLQKRFGIALALFLEEAAVFLRRQGLISEVVRDVGLPWLEVSQEGSLLKVVPIMYGPTDVSIKFHYRIDEIRGDLRQTFQSSKFTPSILAQKCQEIYFPRDQ